MSITLLRPVVSLGQAIEPGDFNAMSGNSRAYLNDIVVGALMRLKQNSVGPVAGPQVYALGHSGAPRNTAVTRSVGCNAGPLFFSPTTPAIDGVNPQVAAYYLQQNEITTQFAVGDATFPRFDAIYVRITEVDGPLATRNFEDAAGVKTSQQLVVDRRVRLEYTVVAGTPAAIPQIPAAPDATWSSWGVWYIPKAWNALFSTMFSNGASNVFDFRVPLDKYTRYLMVPGDGMVLAANAAADTSLGQVTFSGTGSSARITNNLRGRSGRVMGFGYAFNTYVAGVAALRQFVSPLGSTLPWRNSIYAGAHSGDPIIPLADIDNFSLRGGVWCNATGTPVAVSTSGYALLPVWANGWGSEAEDAAQAGPTGTGARTLDFCWAAVTFTPSSTSEAVASCSIDVAG